MDVFLLWHISHARSLDGSPTRHVDEAGDLVCDEQEGDDVKLLGVYSATRRAQDRIREARDLPGFRDEPECFQIAKYQVDTDEWPEGYVSSGRAG